MSVQVIFSLITIILWFGIEPKICFRLGVMLWEKSTFASSFKNAI